MVDLTFGEQVKIVLSRKGMTIKELAEIIERQTGKKMSRQNLTQRLGRDNFQEQDMRMIAEILGCPFRLSILNDNEDQDTEKVQGILKHREYHGRTGQKDAPHTIREPYGNFAGPAAESAGLAQASAGKDSLEVQQPFVERDITIGELMDINEELEVLARQAGQPGTENPEDEMAAERKKMHGLKTLLPWRKKKTETQENSDGISMVNGENQEEAKLHKASGMENGNGPAGCEEKAHSAEGPDEEADKETSLSEGPLEEEMYEEQIYEEQIYEEHIYEESGYKGPSSSKDQEFEQMYAEETRPSGDINPYTRQEYESNSVRMHPKRIGYVQVYDREQHAWTDMTEWAFLGYQERKKALLGNDYEPPIYLD